MNLFICLHLDTSSSRVFSSESGSAFIRVNFSFKCKSHFQLPHTYGRALEAMTILNCAGCYYPLSRWFNVPYSVNLKTSICRVFIRHIKLFNRSNMKISYSCILNIANVIQNHNTSSLKDPALIDIKNAAVVKNQNVHWTKSVY